MFIGRVVWRGGEYPVSKESGGPILGPGRLEIPEEEAVFLPPTKPTKIVCVGRNYRRHAEELGNPLPPRPLLFLKPPSSLLGSGGVIRLPEDSQRVDYEGEIAVVVSRTCKALSGEDDPMDYVLGVAPLNDVTARDLQKLDVQFTRGKSFDTFCPYGPWVATNPDPETLSVVTRLNGKEVQRGSALDMVFSIPFLLSYVSRIMTLNPGDVIATGTPAGVGQLSPGDLAEVAVAGITLQNTVEG